MYSDPCGDVIKHHLDGSAGRGSGHARMSARSRSRTVTFVTCPMAPLAGNVDSASSTYPTWAEGLKKSDLYYNGFVDDIESVFEQHCKDTVTFHGTRNSSGASEVNKENINSSDSEAYTHALLRPLQ